MPVPEASGDDADTHYTHTAHTLRLTHVHMLLLLRLRAGFSPYTREDNKMCIGNLPEHFSFLLLLFSRFSFYLFLFVPSFHTWWLLMQKKYLFILPLHFPRSSSFLSLFVWSPNVFVFFLLFRPLTGESVAIVSVSLSFSLWWHTSARWLTI